MEQCINCKFFFTTGPREIGSQGQCRANPPLMIAARGALGIDTLTSGWPSTMATDGCGKFHQIEDAKAPIQLREIDKGKAAKPEVK